MSRSPKNPEKIPSKDRIDADSDHVSFGFFRDLLLNVATTDFFNLSS